jgi:hypothetical protein
MILNKTLKKKLFTLWTRVTFGIIFTQSIESMEQTPGNDNINQFCFNTAFLNTISPNQQYEYLRSMYHIKTNSKEHFNINNEKHVKKLDSFLKILKNIYAGITIKKIENENKFKQDSKELSINIFQLSQYINEDKKEDNKNIDNTILIPFKEFEKIGNNHEEYLNLLNEFDTFCLNNNIYAQEDYTENTAWDKFFQSSYNHEEQIDKKKILSEHKNIAFGTLQDCSFIMIALAYFLQNFNEYYSKNCDQTIARLFAVSPFLNPFLDIEQEKNIKDKDSFTCGGPKEYQVSLEYVIMMNGLQNIASYLYYLLEENNIQLIIEKIKTLFLKKKIIFSTFLESNIEIKNINPKVPKSTDILKEDNNKIVEYFLNQNREDLKKNEQTLETQFDTFGNAGSGHFSLLHKDENNNLFIILTKYDNKHFSNKIIIPIKEYLLYILSKKINDTLKQIVIKPLPKSMIINIMNSYVHTNIL